MVSSITDPILATILFANGLPAPNFLTSFLQCFFIHGQSISFPWIFAETPIIGTRIFCERISGVNVNANVKPWSDRVKIARVRLLREVQKAPPGAPIRTVVFDGRGNPKSWPGTNIPGNTQARGTWLRTALRNEAEIRQIESQLYRGIPVPEPGFSLDEELPEAEEED